VIWSNTGEGLLKYNHNDKIYSVSFNPVLQNLASCTGIDFGLWQADQANVNKQKVPAKCCSCDWSPDGQILAIGLINGVILIKDTTGVELFQI
jgi:intraflagellar transport protein 122